MLDIVRKVHAVSNVRHQFYSKWLRTRRSMSCLVVSDTADTTVVSAVSATTRHDRFLYLSPKRTRLYTGLALCIVKCGILAQG